MRKLVLAVAVLAVLVWVGWQMLPGPRFAPLGPEPATDGGPPHPRSVAPDGPPRDEPRGPERRDAAPVRRDLQADEARGGHTIARHVGRTDAQLRERLARESISAASTYTDLDTAERVVGLTLRRHAARVQRWEAREGPRPNLVLPFAAPDQPPIGRVLQRGAREAVEAYAAVVVLRWRPDGSFVLTSYPEARPREPQRSGRRGGPAGRQDP
jgi:hypothetical protein